MAFLTYRKDIDRGKYMDNIRGFLKTKKGKIIVAVSAIVVVAIVIGAIALMGTGKAHEGYRTISVSKIVGDVTACHDGKEYDAYTDMNLKEGYGLVTKDESYVRMVLDGDKYIKLEESSKATFETLGKSGSGYTVINLEYGVITNEIASALSDDEDYIINTPNAVLAVRGTFFRVAVNVNEEGDTLTDVYTYGGAVKSQRILPSGQTVEEDVQVDAGYKTTISMDTDDTIYIVERVEDGNENTEPITLSDVPEADLVDMYVASINGHKMFVETEDIWYSIESRDIDVEDYTSNRDGEKVPVYEDEVSHSHTEKTVTKEATCQEKGYTRVICTVCGQVLSETEIPVAGHTEVEIVTEGATCTEPGYKSIQCAVCQQILSTETVEPTGHTEKTTTIEPTGTVPGKTIVSCSVCGEVLSEVEIPVNHTHTVVESTVKPTFTANGSYRKYCSVCDATLESKILDSLPAIYTDDGDIFITPTGYTQGTSGIFYNYEGDYVFAQRDSEAIGCNIYIEGGEHILNFDGVNISGALDISGGAVVNIYGTSKTNYIIGAKGMVNAATVSINSGKFVLSGTMYGIDSISGRTTIAGGSLTISGWDADVYVNELYITGGSVKLENNNKIGSIVNACYVLECIALDTYPAADSLTFKSGPSSTYLYTLNVDDKASDGKYYIWKPVGYTNINETNFPDDNFRGFVSSSIDADKDGFLSAEEANQTSVILLPESLGTVGSLKGIEYFTELKTLQCDCDLAISSLDIGKNTKLQGLFIPGAPITFLDISNNTELRSINISGTNLYMLNLASQRSSLEILNCENSKITYLDVTGCTNLETLNIKNCPIGCVNLEGTSVKQSTFTYGNNIYQGGSYALVGANMSYIEGIDITKVYSVSGADYYEMTGVLTNITDGLVQYKYDCGNEISAEFAVRFE